LLAFLKSPDGLGWDSNRDLGIFLCGVLKHKFQDHLRRDRYVMGSIDDANFRRVIEAVQHSGNGFAARIESENVIAALLKDFEAHPELQEVLKAATAIDGGRNTNQQLAEILHTTPEEIENRKKRISRMQNGGSK
jgi:hypothetical protein